MAETDQPSVQSWFRDRIVWVKRLRVGDCDSYAGNWRRHPGQQMSAMCGVLAERGKCGVLYGFPSDGKGPDGDFSRLTLYDGHLRKSINPDESWWVAATDLRADEVPLVLATFDPLASMAEPDPIALDKLLREVNTGCGELQQMLDDLWSEAQADAIANTEPITEDEPPAPPAVPVTRPGDVWVMGLHRLLCGDCRKPEDVARVMAGEKINVCMTSPPYASQRKYDESSGFKPIKPDEYVAWWEPVQANVRQHLAADGSFFVNIKPHCEDGERVLYVFDLVLAMRRRWGWMFVDDLAWVNPGVPGRWPNRFKEGWEPIYHFCQEAEIKFSPDSVATPTDRAFKGDGETHIGKKGGWIVDNGVHEGLALPSNVISMNVENGAGAGVHAAAFPVGLPSFFYRAFSYEGDVCFDPFMGSGTSIMAAEALNRRGRGIEISATYCDVAVQRWCTKTGQDATRESDGASFRELTTQRDGDANGDN